MKNDKSKPTNTRIPVNPISRIPQNPMARIPFNPNSRIPFNPNSRIPFNPNSRIPFNPNSRMTGDSGRFLENFAKFKNTESHWKVFGFSKSV